MKSAVHHFIRLTLGILICGLLQGPAQAAFSSMYVFGDGVSSTTHSPGGTFYYGNRYSNGRVWVEVLAERQGIPFQDSRNISYYANFSSNVLHELSSFTPPSDVDTALFVVWVCDADLVYNVGIGQFGTNIALWTNSINRYLTNHAAIITNLYSKGVRSLIVPNAVDLGKVPAYIHYGEANKAFIRQQTINFNARFDQLVRDTASGLPGLAVFTPDMFSFVDDVIAYSTNYGLINPTNYVIDDLPPSQWALNGPGTNYVFWDDLDPTAMFHAHIADYVQQILSPVSLSEVSRLENGVNLQIANVPVGRNGVVEGSPDLSGWTLDADVFSTNTSLAIELPLADPARFYRLRFPFYWAWP